MRGSWRPNKDCNIFTPQLLWLTQPFIPVLMGCSSGDLGAQPLLGHGSYSSIFSPTDLNFLSPGLYNNLSSTYFLRVSQFALRSTPRQSRSPPWYLRPDVPVIYTGAFLLLTAWPGVNLQRKCVLGEIVSLTQFEESHQNGGIGISCITFSKIYPLNIF